MRRRVCRKVDTTKPSLVKMPVRDTRIKSCRMLVLIKVNVLNCKKHLVYKYVQVLVAENLSFHSVRLLGHNGTSKPVKVPILPLALIAAVAGKLTARTTFKVLSFFGWLLTIRTNTIYTGHCSQPHRCHYRHYQWCPEFHKELPVRSPTTGQDQKLGLVLDFPKTPGPCYYHKQDWYFQFLYTHRINICILLVLFWRSQIWFSS